MPRLYHLTNTWHNGSSEDRGPVAPDALVAHAGARSLRMIVAAGDEKAVVSDPVALNQEKPRLVEVHARVKTDRLCMLQIDAVDERGRRLDGFNFIHEAPVSIGTDDWREIRQVFRPRTPVRALRLMLCARGSNGYTLDDTGLQPQNNVVGTIWWDDIRLTEPESTADELAARGVRPAAEAPARPGPRLVGLDLGERLLGRNELVATLVNPGPTRTFALRWEFTSPTGKTSVFQGAPREVPAGGRAALRLPDDLDETCPTAYTESRGTLSLRDPAGDREVAAAALWFGTWTTPIDLELGALYLRPDQHQFVRMNLGLAAATRATLAQVRLDMVEVRQVILPDVRPRAGSPQHEGEEQVDVRVGRCLPAGREEGHEVRQRLGRVDPHPDPHPVRAEADTGYPLGAVELLEAGGVQGRSGPQPGHDRGRSSAGLAVRVCHRWKHRRWTRARGGFRLILRVMGIRPRSSESNPSVT